jgi:hypothetical protein
MRFRLVPFLTSTVPGYVLWFDPLFGYATGFSVPGTFQLSVFLDFYSFLGTHGANELFLPIKRFISSQIWYNAQMRKRKNLIPLFNRD